MEIPLLTNIKTGTTMALVENKKKNAVQTIMKIMKIATNRTLHNKTFEDFLKSKNYDIVLKYNDKDKTDNIGYISFYIQNKVIHITYIYIGNKNNGWVFKRGYQA